MTLHSPANTRLAVRIIGFRALSSSALWLSAVGLFAWTVLPGALANITPEEPQFAGFEFEAETSAATVANFPIKDAAPASALMERPVSPVVHASVVSQFTGPSVIKRLGRRDEGLVGAGLLSDRFLDAAMPSVLLAPPTPTHHEDLRVASIDSGLSIRLPEQSQFVRKAPALLPPDLSHDITPSGDVLERIVIHPTTFDDVPPQTVTRVALTERRLLSGVLAEYGIAEDHLHATIVALRADDIEDERQAGDLVDLAIQNDHAGEPTLIAIRLTLSADARVVELSWDDADTSALWARIPETLTAPPVEIAYKPISVVEAFGESALLAHSGDSVFLQGRVKTTLYDAAAKAGLTPGETRTFSNIFRHLIDFQRDISVGDSFEMLFEKKPNGDYGDILYASISTRGEETTLYRGTNSQGKKGYFDADGKTNKRALMRTPIAYARISSGYGMRKHPIRGYRAMHKGVDFAAPRGTPIFAAGDGVVDHVGRRGNYGKYVRIKHQNGYKTAYAHLSRYAQNLRSGQRVKQGEIVGYVGSTGLSTGPHLHFEVHRNGRSVNPTKVADFGEIKGLSGSDLARFMAKTARVNVLVSGLRPYTIVAQATQ